ALETVGIRRVAEVPQHQSPAQDQGGGVGLVLAGVLRRRAVDRLEDRGVDADVRARRHAQSADEARGEGRHDVAIEVRRDEDVVQVRLLDELHAHVVDDAVLELHATLVVSRDSSAALEEQAVGELHDVGLVYGRDLAAAVGDGVLKGEPCDPLRGGTRDDLDALRGVRTHPMLYAVVEILGVLADDHEVDVLVARLDALDRPSWTQVGVEPQRLAKRDVDAPEPLPDRSRDRAFQRDLVAFDRLEDVVRQRCAVLLDYGLTRVDDLPFEADPGRVKDAPRSLRTRRASLSPE